MQEIITAIKKELNSYLQEVNAKEAQMKGYQSLQFEINTMNDKVSSLKSAINRLEFYSETPSIDIPLAGTENAWGDAS